jgi:acetyltransferase-like isoleucine patch superfamily enzyme
MIRNFARRIYRALFPVKEIKTPPAIIGAGNSVSIDPSAILMTHDQGKIIFGGDNYIGRQVEIGTAGTVIISTGTTIQDRCILLGDVEIGEYCTFAPNIYISSGRHYYDHKPEFYIRDQDEMIQADEQLAKQHSKKVSIGDDVWIGINCVIMSGITIGRGAVIGSNSVVTKDVAPFTVVAGMPAKEIKKRLDFSPREKLRFDVDTDLPHFYKGIHAERKSIAESRKQGGLRTVRNFILHLKNGSRVELIVKSAIGRPVSIVYGKQTAIAGTDFSTIGFGMTEGVFHEFTAESGILIKEVNVIN